METGRAQDAARGDMRGDDEVDLVTVGTPPRQRQGRENTREQVFHADFLMMASISFNRP